MKADNGKHSLKKDYEEIPQHPLDLYFRRTTTKLIDEAQHEICVATGEFSIYYFSDVSEAFHDAVRRGISVKAYLGKCDVDTINRAIVDGITVYRGKKAPSKHDQHYMVIDGKHVLVSEDHERYAVGQRHGPLYRDNKMEAEKRIKAFDKLIKNIPPLTKPIGLEKRSMELVTELYQ